MHIILNDQLVRTASRPISKDQIKYFVQDLAAKAKLKDTIFLGSSIDLEAVQILNEGYMGILSNAYSRHEKIEIAPHDFWNLVLLEITAFIAVNVDRCRPLFTTSNEKTELLVPTSSATSIHIPGIIELLRAHVPVDIDTFLPELSTHTEMSRLTMYASFCDAVSPYYSYGTFCCGIPEIRVTGTKEDWQGLADRAREISLMFLSVDMLQATAYMVDVASLFKDIVKSFDFPADAARSFWSDIFRQNNVGSGGQLDINGWILRLMYEKHARLENNMARVAKIPFFNIETKRKFTGVFGPFEQLRTADDFIKTGYASFLFERKQS